ncbi:MAG: universal stress protein [Methanomassiliicoccus sp.]|nr:universal stress protein [Methanomassiliicoccus sp.]
MIPYHRIIIATDGTDKTTPAVQYGLGVAKAMGAEVTAMCVIDESPYENVANVTVSEVESIRYRSSAGAVEAVMAQGRAHGIKMRALMTSGTPSAEIVRASSDHDLIVMGTEGRMGVSHLLLGSVAEKVVRYAPTPILVVHSGMRIGGDLPMVRKLLIPTDGSENTRPAIAQGLALAKLLGAEVTALSVADPGAENHSRLQEGSQRLTENDCHEAVDYIKDLGRDLGAIIVHEAVVTGIPSEEIVKASSEHDLVVMGTVGRTGLAHIRLGSVAERTVRQARCPVLVVRAMAP